MTNLDFNMLTCDITSEYAIRDIINESIIIMYY